MLKFSYKHFQSILKIDCQGNKLGIKTTEQGSHHFQY